VSTGAVDPLEQLADLGLKEDLWVHVDGAYGAVGILDPAVAQQYAGLDRVDSLALDPHKWLSVPVECGCAFVRDGALLRRAFSLVPPYLWTEEGKGFGGLPWYSEYGFQQTRGFRALKLWMTLHQMGKSGVRALVQRQNLLARHLAVLVEAAPDFELMASPNLSIVCFRYVPESLRGDDARLDALNKEIMAEVQAGGVAFITNAVLGDRFVLLRRGRVLGSYPKQDTTIEELTSMMAGGAELAALTHELQALGSDPAVAELTKELAKELEASKEVEASG
jgi:glutamate/tyrosine decarboxylase-like PLP-dependent enzyme